MTMTMALTSDILHESPPEALELVDLPQELQDKIYERYFEGADLRVFINEKWSGEVEGHASKVGFVGIQDLAVELVSRKVSADAKTVRNKIWPRALTVNIGQCLGGDELRTLCSSKY